MTRLIAFVLILLAVCLNGQSKEISGTVTDEEGNPLAGASCILYAVPDSTYIVGTVTDLAGSFAMEAPEDVETELAISYFGFSPVRTTVSSDMTTIFVLHHVDTELSEVVVKGRKPQLMMKDGRLSYNVRDFLDTRILTSAHELLKALPLISSQDGTNISLTGTPNGSVIYINGRQSTMSQSQLLDYLKSIPADQVKDVQIIYAPGPEWKTQSAVINVVLRRLDAYTFNGKINASYKNQSANTINAGGSVFAAMPHFTANIMYGFSDAHSISKSLQYGRHTILMGEERRVYDVFDTIRSKEFTLGHQVYAAIGYDPNAGNHLELSYTGAFSPKRSTDRKSFNTVAGRSHSITDGDSDMNSLSIVYSGSKGIDAGIEWVHSHFTQWQDLYGTAIADDTMSPLTTSRNTQKAERLHVYADLRNPLPRQWGIKYGASYDYLHNANTVINTPAIGSAGIIAEDSRSNTDEHTAKAYVGTYKSFFANRLSADASVACEYYQLGDYRRWNVYPNVNVSFYPNNDHYLILGYNSRKVYPSLWERQDYISYVNNYLIQTGNPQLRPARFDVLQLTYVFRQQYTLSFAYSNIKDLFFTQLYQMPDQLKLMQRTYNLDHSDEVTLTLTVPYHGGSFYYGDVTLQGAYSREKTADWYGYSFDLSDWGAMLMSNNSFIICRTPYVGLEVNGYYLRPARVGLIEGFQRWGINAAAMCGFLDNKLVVRFDANYLLGHVWPGHVRFDSQYMDIDSDYYGRSFTLSLSYRFKGYTDRQRRDVDTSRFGF